LVFFFAWSGRAAAAGPMLFSSRSNSAFNSAFLPLTRQSQQALFIPAQGETFVVEAVNAAFQLAGGPIVWEGFDFVEGAGGGLFDSQERAIVRPG
jgi:hypothetical protein